MIKVLQVISSLGGGVGSMLYAYYKNMNKEAVKFDFIVHGDEKGEFEQYFLDWGSNVYHVVPKKKGYIKNRKRTKEIIRTGGYDIVHCHQDYHGADTVKMAKKLGVKNIIAHSHLAFVPETFIKKIRRNIQTRVLVKNATHFCACSKDAAKWLYGNKHKDKQINIINNAIDVEKFAYNEIVREKLRRELGIGNKFVVGNVGRFTYQKNHEYLLQVFNEVLKIKQDAILFLVGYGELEQEIKKQAKNLGIVDNVIYLGERKDVNKILQAMDVFVFPSRFEGLGIVVLEALASGLGCVVSNKVPEDVVICDKVKMLSLEDDVNVWAETVIGLSKCDRVSEISALEINGYNIKNESKKLEEFYIGMFNKN